MCPRTAFEFLLLGLLTLLLFSGCHRSQPPEFVLNETTNALSPELRDAVRHSLAENVGDFIKPKLLTATDESQSRLIQGQAVYQQRCEQCHGVSGDGNGPSAHFMYPRPRDYRRGIFKFTSTPYGMRPQREDLLRTIRQGIRGTSMPEFILLSDSDQQAVVDYVLMLTRRGELEAQLADMADADNAINEEEVQNDLIPLVLKRWLEAEQSEVFPVTPQPRFTTAHVERGKAAFLTKGCSKCHGEDGRGQTAENRGKDLWGFQTRAADLTSGMLHGGNRPIDIYRRIYNGINGTPMPGFSIALKDSPETTWDLVAYVLFVTSRRREGEIPSAGHVQPYAAVNVSNTEEVTPP